ncbi:MAG: nuclease [Bdellovibrionales bacterium CG12_big_fil_rev_8_21_14_0_65_38_15]|nr:MAG: nuclease [Bdellovibrionales bacterium CG22_combo_CG10-13_8_21_14_all_38_13]PIQ56893.1 MAG: nuclease [Bdellovibrionales bacterium CG12_big_fil_rev_8_21_14_0_65_38_15]PIR30058.1 MAG: nuclease [Bdellovibrionales bacterium CG11_big_fil_rev_8_21_14_0_20_38_13]
MSKAFRLSFIFAIMASLNSAYADFADLPPYYTQDFVQKIDQGTLKNTLLKISLQNILSKIHVKTTGRDLVKDSCPDQSECEEQLTTLTYRQAREILFGKIHLQSNDNGYFLNEVYCRQTISEEDGVGRGQIPDHTQVNCEHTWPQSRFNPNESKNAQLTDLHHLFPSNSRANSSRGNLIFAEVDGGVINEECTSSHRGTAYGSSETAFEPPPEHRGNVARALFYFSVRYNHPIGSLEEEFLKKWHWQDPVDEEERSRNEKVYEVQKNRNPFIDAPELVELVNDF